MLTAQDADSVDVKPRIRPFPLDVDTEMSISEDRAATTRGRSSSFSDLPSPEANTPIKTVKTEPSLLDPDFLARSKHSPIYISSDSDADEVDAQMNASQTLEQKDQLDGDEDEEEDELGDSSKEADQSEAIEGEEDGRKVNATASGTEVAPRGTSHVVQSSSSSSSSSSSPSLSPFRSSSQVRPRPRPILSQPPVEPKKRPRPSLPPSQVVKSSTQSQGKTTLATDAVEPNTTSEHLSDTSESEHEEEKNRYTKRARRSGSSTGPTPRNKRRTKHETYWFLDGSVILELGGIMFKLHRSRLVQHSSFFFELFSNTMRDSPDRQADSKEQVDLFDFVDKCPVYPLKGVSVKDFEELLLALDNAISYVFRPPEFSQLASILRAARTLRFTALDDFASRILREMWSNDLAKLSSARIPHASKTIILARSCDMPELLKRAFYELVRTSRLGEDEDADLQDPDVLGSQISRADLARLIRAREELTARWLWAADSPPDILCPLSAVDPPSDESAKCIQARAQNLPHWQDTVKKTLLFEECLYDPLHGLERLVQIDWAALGYCQGCVKAWRESWVSQRKKLWQQLDVWLGLPTEDNNA
ncbi:hypothetical protein BDW22DRAFT_1362552 [Trametopsis cervina]|nr:hypothetical protein BDW22DRAFT_1362552 [Trametopsis cervina]